MKKIIFFNDLFTPRLNAVLEVGASDWVDLDGNVITFPPGWAIDEASINPARRMTCAVNLSTKTFSAVAFGFLASAMYVDAPPSSPTNPPVTDDPEEGKCECYNQGSRKKNRFYLPFKWSDLSISIWTIKILDQYSA